MFENTAKAIAAEARPYAYSISLDCNAKGYIQPSVKMQSDTMFHADGTTIEREIVLLLDRLVKELRQSGYKIATDIEEVSKNGKD